MKFLVKIIVGVGVGVFLFGGGVFAGNGSDKCRQKDGLSTSIMYDEDEQTPYCFYTEKEGKTTTTKCEDWEKENISKCSGTVIRVYNDDGDSVADKKGLDLIQYFLSTILGFALKFGAMLAVLAIIVGGIQVSVSMEGESKGPGKEKIMGGIAALLVLFFAGVILNFINPNYYVW